MPKKLTQAKIPMCPKCGAAMIGPMCEGDSTYACNECDHTMEYPPNDWGYYDHTAEVAREIREHERIWRQMELPMASALAKSWADRLEGKND